MGEAMRLPSPFAAMFICYADNSLHRPGELTFLTSQKDGVPGRRFVFSTALSRTASSRMRRLKFSSSQHGDPDTGSSPRDGRSRG
jgi:hypothetical protein